VDLSLFRDESQLKKRKSSKRTPRRKGKENTSGAEDGFEGLTGDESEEEVKKKPKPNKRVEKPKVAAKEKVKTKEKPVEKRAERASERGRDRDLAAKRRSESTAAAAAAAVKNAAVKQTVAKHAIVRQSAAKAPEKKPRIVAKPTKKPEPVAESSIPTRSAKTRSKHTSNFINIVYKVFTGHCLSLHYWIQYNCHHNICRECLRFAIPSWPFLWHA
jgi:hypothetical protein